MHKKTPRSKSHGGSVLVGFEHPQEGVVNWLKIDEILRLPVSSRWGGLFFDHTSAQSQYPVARKLEAQTNASADAILGCLIVFPDKLSLAAEGCGTGVGNRLWIPFLLKNFSVHLSDKLVGTSCGVCGEVRSYLVAELSYLLSLCWGSSSLA